MNSFHGIAVHLNHIEHWFPVLLKSFKRALLFRDACGLHICLQMQNRGQRAGNGPAFVAIVWQTKRHQQRTEVGKTESERTELVAITGNGLGRVAGIIHKDFLSGDVNFHRRLVALDVNAAVFPAELH